MKKVLSLVLVIAMVLSSMSFAFASTFEDVTGDYEKAVDALAALGVINGYEDGTFRPTNTIKRAELAKLLVEALGYGNLVAGASSSFSDTQGHWASGYIAIANGTGLVLGYPDGTFQPEKAVTFDEALTMVVRALGYTDASLKGTWPTNYKVKAIDLGLTKNVTMASTQAVRGGVAQILYNALEKAIVEVDADGIATPVEPAKVLIDNIATRNKNYPVDEDTLDPDSKNYGGNLVDLTPYVYQNIDVYVSADDEDVVVYVRGTNTLTLEGTVTANTTADVTVEDADEDEYTFDVTSNAAILLNGEEVKYADFVDVADELEDAEVTLVLDAEDDDKLDEDEQKVVGIVARLVTDTVQLDEVYVEDEVELVTDALDVSLPVNDDDEVEFDKLKVTGDAESLDEIEEKDVLALYYAKGVVADDVKLEILVTRNTVEGKITRINSDGDVTIDGTAYELGDLAIGELSAGDEVILYLDQNGDIYSYDELGSTADNDFALVVDVKDGYETTGGVRLAEPKVKVLTADGEKITYVLDDADLTTIVTQSGQDLNVALADGDLIRYNVNKDGEIDQIDLVNEANDTALELDYTTETSFKTTGNSFNLASNVVIFSRPADIDDAEVVTEEDLDDTIDATVVYDGAKIVALVVTDGVGSSEGTYAVMAIAPSVVLDEDGDKVNEYTAFVDGEQVPYLGKSTAVVSGSAVNGTLVELSLSTGKLDGVTPVVDDAANDIKVLPGTAADVRITTYITLVSGAKAYLSDDVVVYVYDISDGEVELGDKSDIRENDFVAYNLSLDETNDYEIVIVTVQ